MSDANPRPRSVARLIVGAIVAGALAGSAVVAFQAWRGGAESVSGENVASGDCSDAKAIAAKLTPLATGDVAAMTPQDMPRSIAALAFTDADGKARTIADFSGKTLLVNLWATWCVPCREEMPALDRLQGELGGEDFDIVAINIDQGDNAKPLKFLQEIGVKDLAFHHDPTMGVFNTLKKEGLAFGLPLTLMADRKGCLIGAMNGPADWSGADAKALVEGVMDLQGAKAAETSGDAS